MDSGYLSVEAVNSLLAVKEGEKDYLKLQISKLLKEIDILKKQLSPTQ